MARLHNFWYLFIKLNVDDEYVYDSYEDDVDECKGGSLAIKELDNDTMSIHDKFKAMEEISKNDNWKHGKLCCSEHGYVFQDLCEVHSRRFTEISIQTLWSVLVPIIVNIFSHCNRRVLWTTQNASKVVHVLLVLSKTMKLSIPNITNKNWNARKAVRSTGCIRVWILLIWTSLPLIRMENCCLTRTIRLDR